MCQSGATCSHNDIAGEKNHFGVKQQSHTRSLNQKLNC